MIFIRAVFFQIPPEDIRWDGEESGVALNIGHGSGSFRGNRRSQIHGGRGRGPRIHQPRRELVPPPTQQNGGVGRRTSSDDIELFNTESLVKEVSFFLSVVHPLSSMVVLTSKFCFRWREFSILRILIRSSSIRPRKCSRFEINTYFKLYNVVIRE